MCHELIKYKITKNQLKSKYHRYFLVQKYVKVLKLWTSDLKEARRSLNKGFEYKVIFCLIGLTWEKNILKKLIFILTFLIKIV